jgi:RNA polymerase sigma-70 factor (ECF subfamily)
MVDDLATIRRVVAGDRDAFRILVERYQRPLFVLIRNLLDNAHDTEDVAQEVFLAAYRGLRDFDPTRAAFSTWLWTIARNKCLNVLGKRRPVLVLELPEANAPSRPEAGLAEAEFAEQLDVALAALPFEQKTVFVLAEIQELSNEEIARIEQIGIGTVKSRLSRAKEKLRVFFERALE